MGDGTYLSDVTGGSHTGYVHEVRVAPIGWEDSQWAMSGELEQVVRAFRFPEEAEMYVRELRECQDALRAVIGMGGLCGVSVRIRHTRYVDGQEDEWFAYGRTQELFSIRTDRKGRDGNGTGNSARRKPLDGMGDTQYLGALFGGGTQVTGSAFSL